MFPRGFVAAKVLRHRFPLRPSHACRVDCWVGRLPEVVNKIVHASGLWRAAGHEAEACMIVIGESDEQGVDQTNLLREGEQCENCTKARSNVKAVAINLSR